MHHTRPAFERTRKLVAETPVLSPPAPPYRYNGFRFLAAAFLCLFSWSSGLADLAALAVGYSALQALKCCCSPNR